MQIKINCFSLYFYSLPKTKYLILASVGCYCYASSVKQLKEFIERCRGHLKSDSNLFWVALQSNQMADLSNVEDDFKKALDEMKKDLSMNGWVLPTLETNMRNQINISC